MKRRHIIIVLFFVTASAFAQHPSQGVYLPVLIDGKDTIPYIVLPEVRVLPIKLFRNLKFLKVTIMTLKTGSSISVLRSLKMPAERE